MCLIPLQALAPLIAANAAVRGCGAFADTGSPRARDLRLPVGPAVMQDLTGAPMLDIIESLGTRSFKAK